MIASGSVTRILDVFFTTMAGPSGYTDTRIQHSQSSGTSFSAAFFLGCLLDSSSLRGEDVAPEEPWETGMTCDMGNSGWIVKDK